MVNVINLKSIEKLRDNFRQHVGKHCKKIFANNGVSFKFSRLSINKIGCIKSINNSVKHGFTPKEHFEVAENIKELFEHSKVFEKYTVEKKSRTEIHTRCICETTGNVFAYLNVVTWNENEGYIDLYLSKEA